MLFVDTSAFLALADPRDPTHERAVACLREVSGRHSLVTSNYVFDEAVTRARRKLGHPSAVRLGEGLRASAIARTVVLQEGDIDHAWRLFRQFHDQDLSFTDCTSFALMKRLDIRAAFAFDEDFRKAGFEVVPAASRARR